MRMPGLVVILVFLLSHVGNLLLCLCEIHLIILLLIMNLNSLCFFFEPVKTFSWSSHIVCMETVLHLCGGCTLPADYFLTALFCWALTTFFIYAIESLQWQENYCLLFTTCSSKHHGASQAKLSGVKDTSLT